MSRTFDFQSYLRRQKRVDQRESIQHFEDYTFIEDMRQRRLLSRFSVIRRARSYFEQYWLMRERGRYLKFCADASQDAPELESLWIESCQRFKIEHPKLYLRSDMQECFTVLGDSNSSFVVLRANILNRSRAEKLFVFGSALAAIQNGHSSEMTILSFMDRFIKHPWQLKLSKGMGALLRWEKMAEITRDRGGMLLARDYRACATMIALEKLDWDENEISQELSRRELGKSVDWENKSVQFRLEALDLFTKSRLYLAGIGKRESDFEGMSLSDIDERLQSMLEASIG